MKIYLEEPITIDGIKVHHTEEGINHLLEHYELMLEIANVRKYKIDDKGRNHISWLIDNFKIHKQLYENQKQHNGKTPDNNSLT